MRWLTNFYDFRFKWTATAAIGIHPTKAWLSQLVDFKNATWHFRRTICSKMGFLLFCVNGNTTSWILTKYTEKKLDVNKTELLNVVLNKSWKEYPSKQWLNSHLPPISKSIQVKRTRYARLCWRSKDKLIRDALLWTSKHVDVLVLAKNQELIHICSVQTLNIAWKTN